MKKVILKQLDHTELQVLQLHISEFAQTTGKGLKNSCLTSFLDSMIALDIAGNLWYLMRNKIEKEAKLTNLNLSISQAATVAKCCHSATLEPNDIYSKTLLLKISGSIDQQLKSFT